MFSQNVSTRNKADIIEMRQSSTFVLSEDKSITLISGHRLVLDTLPVEWDMEYKREFEAEFIKRLCESTSGMDRIRLGEYFQNDE